MVGLPRVGFSLFSCVDPQKFPSQDSDPFKKCPTRRWVCKASNEITLLSPISETSVLQDGCWDTLGGPVSFPAPGAPSRAELRLLARTGIAGHVLSCSAQRVWQNFGWERKLLPMAQELPPLKQSF